MSVKVDDQAFVTLVTNDRYAYGALVVGQSLRDVGTTRQLAILITPEVTQSMRRQLSLLYDYIQEVNPLDSHDDAHLALLTRPDLGITFTKLYCWRLTQYTKCVFLDADTLAPSWDEFLNPLNATGFYRSPDYEALDKEVLQNVDDLFDREELSAAPDVGWPDCFNSGVFVFKPSHETYRGLLQCAVTQGSFDGGDQGLLNTFFSDWATADINKHLPFIYNMTSAVSYSYLPAFRRFGNEVRIVHFIGRTKPWMYRCNAHTGVLTRPSDVDVSHDLSFVRMWWNVFMSKVKPGLEKEQGLPKLLLEVEAITPPSIVASHRSGATMSHDSTDYDHRHHHDFHKPKQTDKGHTNAPHHHDHHHFLSREGVHSAPLSGAHQHQSLPHDDMSRPTCSVEDSTTQSSICGADERTNVEHDKAEDRIPLVGVDLADSFGDLNLSGGDQQQTGPPSPRANQHAWERGQVDYRGQDSFDNIMGRITEVMSDPAVAAAVVDSNSITPVNISGAAAAENNATKS